MHHVTAPPAKELRASARAALHKKWAFAVLVTILASMLGVNLAASLAATGALELDPWYLVERFGSPFAPGFFPAAYAAITDFLKAVSENFDSFWSAVRPALLGALVTLLSLGSTYLVVGSPIQLGLARVHLALTDGESPDVGTLFYAFRDQFFKALWLRVLRLLRILLWSLLLIVPGVIASYRYAMASYVMAENPGMSAGDALRESARMMEGNKWRLFCLRLSFIGYRLLSVITFGIVGIWLDPYVGQAEAQFYHQVSGRAAVRDMVEGLKELSEGL